MSRLILVSNRVTLPDEQPVGGLAVALRDALEQRGGIWFGWSGARNGHTSGTLHQTASGNVDFVTLDLSDVDQDEYYNGFTNRSLWPLLHFRPDLVDYTRETRDGYRRVNALFADKLVPFLKAGDTIWIHDYHLIPLGALLRERGIGCRIGFFLHVPMPSSDMVAALPGHQDLFGALTSYDLVGFQTLRDVERYQDYVRLFGGGTVIAQGHLEDASGRRFRVGAFPVSINTSRIAEQASRAVRKPGVLRLRASLAEHALAIGVDRLDYSKGLPERFRGFARYLARHPEQRGQLTLLQVAPLTRSNVPEYQMLRRELEGLSGNINGEHAAPDWTPVRYVNSNFPHDVLTGFYRLADLALVTPLRDGMNLVAKEYVAAQAPENPGVLILSRFAGAAYELPQALLVNPYDLDGVADAIAEALVMDIGERKQRWEAMMQTLTNHDVQAWQQGYLAALGER